MTEQATEKSSIQVIERTSALFAALAELPSPASLKALAAHAGLHPSTAHRILASLASARLVERHEGGTYALGMRLLELGAVVKARLSIRDVARPLMERLHESIGEAVNLGVRDGDEIIYIERTSGGRALLRVVYLVGGRAPLHLTSLGKLFLAADSADAVLAYARRSGLPGKTPHSLTTQATLERELDWIRRHDLAFDNEEAEIGLRCVAAPIRDDEGHVIAGLSVSAPSERHDARWAAQVKSCAQAISQALGYRPPAPTRLA
ncbi:helix-turn-helix domain-containing protein [Rhodocyclus tenuis]|uniref:IclR family transcriptional regulator n=1 Tax=Rhodocyclus gracilis TaxID=2929842 RepID=UPI001298BD50|nr:IclR family transcriptional regulator [Rhodocyclus gracilis]MRD72626.1 helix-turn-helix domain-containing protein [Rhodocyclus gracilis]